MEKFKNYINHNYNYNKLEILISALSYMGIKPSISFLTDLIASRTDLFPAVEAPHILAFQLATKENRGSWGWKQSDYEHKLNHWWDNFNRTKAMWFKSKMPYWYQKACEILEKDLPAPAPEWPIVADTIEDFKKDLGELWYQDAIAIRLMRLMKEYEGEDLSHRAHKLIKDTGYDGTGPEGCLSPEVVLRFKRNYEKKLIPEDLQQYIIAHHSAFGCLLEVLRGDHLNWIDPQVVKDVDHLMSPEPVIIHNQPEPEPEPQKVLWQGMTRAIPGSVLKMMVDVEKDDPSSDLITVRTIGPVRDKWVHEIPRDKVVRITPEEGCDIETLQKKMVPIL